MIAGGWGRFLIGGPAPAITAVEPLWNDLGSGYTHCGPAGAGATMKILANSLLITGVASLAEAIATARRQAIPDEFLRSLLADSPVISLASNLRLDSLLDATHPGWFSWSWLVKTFASPSAWPKRPESACASDPQPKRS